MRIKVTKKAHKDHKGHSDQHVYTFFIIMNYQINMIMYRRVAYSTMNLCPHLYSIASETMVK